MRTTLAALSLTLLTFPALCAGLSRFTYDGSCQTNSEGREG